MSEAADTPATPSPSPVIEARHRRQLVITVVRIVVVTGLLFAIYAVTPFDRPPRGSDGLWLLLALAVYCVIVVLQILAVARSSYPGLRALEAISVSVPLLIFFFAAVYVMLSTSDPSNFTEPVDHVGGVYFTMTTFATVGFGDIAAKSDSARIIVTLQMILDLLFIGVVARVLFGTVQRRREVLGAPPPGTRLLGTRDNPDVGVSDVDRAGDEAAR